MKDRCTTQFLRCKLLEELKLCGLSADHAADVALEMVRTNFPKRVVTEACRAEE